MELVITSHDSERPNFSENTDLSEILFIARRLERNENPGSTVYVNLWRNPRSIHEALDHATRISAQYGLLSKSPNQTRIVKAGSRTIGEATSLPAPKDSQNWTGAIFAQSYLMQAHWSLDHERKLRLPADKRSYSIALCRLDELGTLGYDARDIFDAFDIDKAADSWSPYPAFWNHDADKVRTISQKPNASLLARTEALEGRQLKSATAVWSKAGKLLLVSRLRTNTHRVIGVGHPKKVLGNTWWGFDDSGLSDRQRKAFLLWINSTLGILLYYGRRAITEGAWMQMKKPAWSSMPVLDVRTLNRDQLTTLAHWYDALSKEELAPIAQLNSDETRRKIDAAICGVLELPDLSPIRELLSREPGLSAKDIGPTNTEEADDV